MIYDFRKSNSTFPLDTDLCIIGAGAAGITIARAFIGTGIKVCLIESGGLEHDCATQSLSEGVTSGIPWGTDLTTSRLRRFGGTTYPWGGGCIPLDELDFEEKPWVPHSGWPIKRADMEPYYERACGVVQISGAQFDDEDVLEQISPPHTFDPEKLIHRYGLSSPTRFGEVYRAELRDARNIHVLLNANLVALKSVDEGRTVTQAEIRTISGRTDHIKARYFILACGGIENARLLLLSNTAKGIGLGNDNDLVGRFFMDHPSGDLGRIQSGQTDTMSKYYDRFLTVPGRPARPEITVSPLAQARHGLLNARLRPQRYEDAIPDGVLAARELKAGIRNRQLPGGRQSLIRRMVRDMGSVASGTCRKLAGAPVVGSHYIAFEGFFEQAPNPDSRITLGDSYDRIGQRQVSLEWRLSELDHHSYKMTAELFASEFDRLGLGAVKCEPWLERTSEHCPNLKGAAHHLGTTRMSNDPRTGVVDKDCKLHSVDNLFMAGGSVFPTGGWAWPTLTIVALSIRLADHLRPLLE